MHDFIDAERERIFAALAELLIDGIANIATAVDVCLTDDCCNLARKVSTEPVILIFPIISYYYLGRAESGRSMEARSVHP